MGAPSSSCDQQTKCPSWAAGRIDSAGGCCYLGGCPGSASGEEPACQCRRRKRREFDTRVGEIPWRRKQQPTPVLLPAWRMRCRGAWRAAVRGVAEGRTRPSARCHLGLHLGSPGSLHLVLSSSRPTVRVQVGKLRPGEGRRDYWDQPAVNANARASSQASYRGQRTPGSPSTSFLAGPRGLHLTDTGVSPSFLSAGWKQPGLRRPGKYPFPNRPANKLPIKL